MGQKNGKVLLTLVDREANDNHIDTKLAEHLYAPVKNKGKRSMVNAT